MKADPTPAVGRTCAGVPTAIYVQVVDGKRAEVTSVRTCAAGRTIPRERLGLALRAIRAKWGHSIRARRA
jgi:hypothetical protein